MTLACEGHSPSRWPHHNLLRIGFAVRIIAGLGASEANNWPGSAKWLRLTWDDTLVPDAGTSATLVVIMRWSKP